MIIKWLSENYIEVIGVLLSLFYLWLSIKQNIWLWPVGIASAVMYIIVFFSAKFYADMGLNVYYFFISIYGWFNWKHPGNEEKQPEVSRLKRNTAVILLLIFLVLFFIMGYVLKRYTDSPIPYWDALTTSGSIVATWMLTRKILEHWVLWVFIDLISMGLYIYRGLFPTTILFAVYTTMAVIGFYSWKKSMNRE